MWSWLHSNADRSGLSLANLFYMPLLSIFSSGVMLLDKVPARLEHAEFSLHQMFGGTARPAQLLWYETRMSLPVSFASLLPPH